MNKNDVMMSRLSLVQDVLHSPQWSLLNIINSMTVVERPKCTARKQCRCIACSHAPEMSIIIKKHLSFPPHELVVEQTTSLSLIYCYFQKLYGNSVGKKCLYPAVSIHMWFQFGICAFRGLHLITPFVTIPTSSCKVLRNGNLREKKNKSFPYPCYLL